MSTNHNLFEENGEPKRYPTEVLLLRELVSDRFYYLATWAAARRLRGIHLHLSKVDTVTQGACRGWK